MKFTTLETTLGFDSRDIHRLSTSPDGNKIDNDSVPTFVLGTIINSIPSTYSNTPIFNLKNLQNIGLLDLNPQSASQDDLSILMTSNKNAACNSNTVSVDIKASANFAGIIGASTAAHCEQSMSLANSDGNIYVSMQRGKHGSYYAINTRDLIAGYDLTPFLIGNELDETEVERYISYKEKSVEGKHYINELIFGGYEKSGLINWNQRNIYGNIQLLTKMEVIFSFLLQQYKIFEKDKVVQPILYANMVILKNKISHAVRDFYAHVGTHFVRKLHFSNYAYGYGTLEFDESSGNQESRVGVAASLNGGLPSKFSIEAGTSASYAKKNGWASEMKNLSIEAHTRPADVVDINSFATSIKAILDAQDKALSVPNLSVPVSPKVELLDIPEVKKKHLGPPDSVFSSYADWKEYQKDIKKDKVKDSINKINEDVDEKSIEVLLDDEQIQTNEALEINKNASQYKTYEQELNALKNQDEILADKSSASNSNLLRIEDMFVSGYETESYESVIPSLRTCKIALPEKEGQIDIYPNATKVLLVINLFRQLADYIRFISSFTISNISEQLATNIDRFHDEFSRKGYEMVTTHMSAGKDIGATLLHDYAQHMYVDNTSELYVTLGEDIDHFHYIKYLLKPEVMHLWRDAPGGYAPFFFETNSSLRFAGLKELIFTPLRLSSGEYTSTPRFYFDLTKAVKDTPDITQFYAKHPESPYYPVFRYGERHEPKLLFLQLAGRYQLIFGKNGLIQPLRSRHVSSKETILSMTTGSISLKEISDINESVIDALIGEIEGFDINKINNDYALYFPDKTQTKELRKANRVIMLSFNWDQEFSQSYTAVKLGKEGLWGVLYQDIVTPFAHYGSENTGDVVNVDDGSKLSVKGFPVLLPIDYSKITAGYGSLLMGSSFGAGNFIDSPTYDSAVIASMHC